MAEEATVSGTNVCVRVCVCVKLCIQSREPEEPATSGRSDKNNGVCLFPDAIQSILQASFLLILTAAPWSFFYR